MEISQRLRAGEVPARIEADFVARYGDRIRALGTSTDPRLLIGVVTSAACVSGLILLWWVLRRGRPSPEKGPTAAVDQPADPRFDERLDDELAVFPD
jgi:cytochrome c-type biogenesis protein CcmH/NrfF